jgi:hypothetical protein
MRRNQNPFAQKRIEAAVRLFVGVEFDRGD